MKKYLPVLRKTFWLVMAIHLVVFTAIGLFTPRGWGLLYIFLIGFAAVLVVMAIVRLIRRQRQKPPGSEK